METMVAAIARLLPDDLLQRDHIFVRELSLQDTELLQEYLPVAMEECTSVLCSHRECACAKHQALATPNLVPGLALGESRSANF
jgi:hypothetical protein